MLALSPLALTSCPLTRRTQIPPCSRNGKCVSTGLWGSKTKDLLVKHQTKCEHEFLAQSRDSRIVNHARKGKGSASEVVEVPEDKSIRDRVHLPQKIRDQDHGDMVLYIKKTLSTIDDGRINISPYDTAWFGLIKDVDGSDSPQFPASLSWIAENQLLDGSWGDASVFSTYDRLLNTLACVIALKSWDMHPDKSVKGIKFISENICKLEGEDVENMTIGFEVLFPALLDRAQSMGINISCNTPKMMEIYAIRDQKITRIPKDVLNAVRTTLHHSLEAFQDLEWDKLLKLKSDDGSFLTSPSSTAFVFMETKDEKCFNYVNRVASKFNGAAPTVFPVDLFARLFAIDRLQRLKISHYFCSEIKDCLDYVYRFWNKEGICWASNSNFRDLDDTSMGFRLLRLHGYNVTADVFDNFKEGDLFCTHQRQLLESASPMFNLYRASQVRYPGEQILEEANAYAKKFLQRWLTSHKQLDKWVIAKDLPSEVRYALEMPWYANLPHIETRLYIEMYGGAKDVWIGKTLYRMHDVNDDVYLKLAKLDYNKCQAQHVNEWIGIQEWYAKCDVGDFRMSQDRLLSPFFLATASVYEPERSRERLAWTKSMVFSEMIKSYFKATSVEEKKTFLKEFQSHFDGTMSRSRNHPILNDVLDFLHELSLDAKQQGIDIRQQLLDAWENWLMRITESSPSGEVAELLVQTLNLCTGRVTSVEILSQLEYIQLSKITNKICHQLHEFKINRKVFDAEIGNDSSILKEIDADMQVLLKMVLPSSTVSISRDIKQTFLTVAKAFYYSAYCAQETIDIHISKVLFESIE